MNFQPTEDRRMLADLLARYVAEQYPIATRHAIAASARGYSEQHWKKFAELGVMRALFSEEQGGFGGAGFDIAVVFEALGRGLVLEPLLASAVLAGSAIAHAGGAGWHDTLASLIDGSQSRRWRTRNRSPTTNCSACRRGPAAKATAT